ncbi:MAG: CHAT domain-containing protein [Okeania sp. SIO2C9]|uniref:CHAT domain-containing protein n=1 Tax=Okeania sp. SIO2C9 TaxID=2607791 RepID=UPI0013BF3631|nr:CHAT domain-containing protein [Okeania sp. SIO2C9]NEQ75678.1 CHAT domain-containing protein [Okeania sp. SIO2C9]
MKKILIFLSNPTNSSQLRLGKEHNAIDDALKQSKKRDEFQVVSKLAVRVKDLRRTLLELEDNEQAIVHFSGHGAGSDGLILEDDSGKIKLVSTEALAILFKQFQQQVECVILNACYSEQQAEAVHQHIDCVIGMNKVIGDVAAINFATAFYEALGAGKTYEKCFEFARGSLNLQGIPESETPKIRYRPQRNNSDIQEAKETKNPDNSSSPPVSQTMTFSGGNVQGPVGQAGRDLTQTANQSQSFANVSFSGSGNNFNAINSASGSVNIDQSQTQTFGENSESKIETVLAELEKLKQEIATTSSLSLIQKKQVEIPVEMLETELKKPQPDKGLIDEAVEALEKGLEGVEKLAGPVMKVATILAKVWV